MELAFENLSNMSNAEASLFWSKLTQEMMVGEDSAARETLAVGRPVYYREKDTPAGLSLKKYPDGRIELVKLTMDSETVIRQVKPE